jgi:hypothetical protein
MDCPDLSQAGVVAVAPAFILAIDKNTGFRYERVQEISS